MKTSCLETTLTRCYPCKRHHFHLVKQKKVFEKQNECHIQTMTMMSWSMHLVGAFLFQQKKLSTFNSDHPTITFTDNTTANLTEYPMNYADPNSPIDGLQELRSLTFELRK